MVQEHQLSERRACRLVRLSRDAHRHPLVATPENQMPTEPIKAIALARRRFSYRCGYDLLRA
jgi:putative transposase